MIMLTTPSLDTECLMQLTKLAYDETPFFLSSRRRHTRCSRDWSSDVCSSDLPRRRSRRRHRHCHRRAASCCRARDRKSTRLNSSHGYISYAVFCLKKKKKIKRDEDRSAVPSERGAEH